MQIQIYFTHWWFLCVGLSRRLACYRVNWFFVRGQMPCRYLSRHVCMHEGAATLSRSNVHCTFAAFKFFALIWIKASEEFFTSFEFQEKSRARGKIAVTCLLPTFWLEKVERKNHFSLKFCFCKLLVINN